MTRQILRVALALVAVTHLIRIGPAAFCLIAVLATSLPSQSVNATPIIFQFEGTCTGPGIDSDVGCESEGLSPGDPISGNLAFDDALFVSTTVDIFHSDFSSFDFTFGNQSFGVSDLVPSSFVRIDNALTAPTVSGWGGGGIASAINSTNVLLQFAGSSLVVLGDTIGPGMGQVLGEGTWTLAPQQVIDIDIKPGGDPNAVNPKSKGVIPVAVLGSMDFDATQVDFSTVEFGPGKAPSVHDGHVENVNGDDFDDMVFHFKVSDTGIVCGDTDATLTGETFGGQAINGTDAVKTAGCQ